MAEKEDSAESSEQQEQKPQYLTADEYNKAQTAWRSRTEKNIEKRVEERLAQLLAERELAPAKEPKDNDEVAALKRQLDEEVKARKKETAARESERKARMREEEDQALRGALRKAGIEDEDLLEGAASLHHSKGRITRDESGRVCFKRQDAYGNDELVPVEEGVKGWTSSPQGKKYLPPIGVGGSGTRSRFGAQPGTNQAPNPKALADAAILRLSGIKF